MTQRRRLDAFLAEHAVAGGAELRDGVGVEGDRVERTGVSAWVGGDTVRASVLVGADGANGLVARSAGLGDGMVRGVGLEGMRPLEALRDEARGTAVIEFGVVPGGYGWVFPKGDHANLGVGGWGKRGAAASRPPRPARACARGRAGRAHRGPRARLPHAALGTPAAAGRVLLVGDAAGLVDPLSGDGMYEAFVSRASRPTRSSRATSTATRGALCERARPPRRGIVGREAGARPTPRTVFAAARAPGVFRVVAGLLCGDVAHPSDARGVARGPLRLIARLAG